MKSKRRKTPFKFPEYLTNYNLPPLDHYKSTVDCKKSLSGCVRVRKDMPFFSRWPKLMSAIYELPFEVVRDACIEVLVEMDHRIAYKGFVQTMIWFKTVHGAYLRFAANSVFDPIPHNNLDDDGLVKEFPNLNILVKSVGPEGPRRRQIVSSILQIFRLYEPPGEKPSISSIVDSFPLPYSSNYEVGNFVDSLIPHIEDSPINLKLFNSIWIDTVQKMFPANKQFDRLEFIKDKTRVHCSSRNGPNGPAVPTAPIDYYVMDQKGMLPAVEKWIEGLGNDELFQLIDLIQCYPPKVKQRSSRLPQISKICVKLEVGGKTRLFAIVDHLTQSCLTGLHAFLFRKVLGSIKEDGTFDHGLAAEKAKDMTLRYTSSTMLKDGSRYIIPPHLDKSSKIYSLDLSTATDRLPVLLQAEIVGQIFGSAEMGETWKTLMVDRDFHYFGQDLRYSVGQPMGALSSWAMLAVTHHIIVRTCFKYVRRPYNGNYLIIGDDVVIRDGDAARVYEFIMTRVLHVPISRTKGYSPELLSGRNPLDSSYDVHSTVEIAKRVMYNGHEISGISPNVLKDIMLYPGSLPGNIKHVVSKLSSSLNGYTLSWNAVKILSQLSFESITTVQVLTLICQSALATISKTDLETEDDNIRILRACPWIGDPVLSARLIDGMVLNLASNIGRKWDSVYKDIDEIYLFNETTFTTKNFTSSWSMNRFLYDMVLMPLCKYLTELVDDIRANPIGWDNLEVISDLYKGLDNVITFDDIIGNSKRNVTPTLIRLSKSMRALFKDSIKGLINDGTLVEIDDLQQQLIDMEEVVLPDRGGLDITWV